MFNECSSRGEWKSHFIHLTLVDFSRRFKENAVKISQAYKERPRSPLETAIFWTEYAIKFDRELVVSHARHMNFFTFYSLDVIIPLVIVVVISITIW